jgi:hypothetical protein
MIICKECGHHNAGDDAFCGSCGAFLEWAGEAVVEPVPPPPATVEHHEPEPPRAGLVERVKASLGLEDDSRSPDGPTEHAAAAGDEPAAEPAVEEPASPVPPASRLAPPPSVPVARPAPLDDLLATAPPPAPAPDAPVVTPGPAPRPAGPDPAPVVDLDADRAAPLVSRPREEETRRPTAAPPSPTTVARQTGGAASGGGGMKTAEERQRPGPQRMEPATRAIRPGDLICGQCGEGNEPSRRFCRRCGTTLVEAVAVKAPWWQRFVPRRSKKAPVAGTRRGQNARRGRGLRGGISRAKSLRTKLFKVLLVLSVLGVGASFTGPFKDPIRDALGTGKEKLDKVVGEPVPVRPTSAVATSQLAGRDAGRLIDQIRNTSWAEAAPGFGEGTAIDVVFDSPVDLVKVGVTSGASETPEAFVAQPRPRDVVVVFSDNSSRTLRLEDTPDFQSFDVSAKDVTSAHFEIRSVYGGTGGDATAVAELEFFGRS